MKGLVVTEDNKLYLEEKLPIPEIGEYEALVKNECCMICNGTDLGVIGGKVREVTRYPAVLGHEDAGRVVKIGKKVTSFKVGGQDNRIMRNFPALGADLLNMEL